MWLQTALALAAFVAAIAWALRERRLRRSGEAHARATAAAHQAAMLRGERARQLALDRIDQAERRLAHVADAASDALLIVAPDGAVASANAAASTLYRASSEDLEGLAARDLVRGEHALLGDGARVPVRVTRDAWKEGGESWGLVWLRDLSPGARALAERNAHEARARRLADAGLASLTAADHLRAPLASLRGAAARMEETLQAALAKPTTQAAMAALSQEEILMADIRTMERIVKTLEDATRATEGTPDAVDVNAVAEGALGRATLPGAVRVHKELLASAPAYAVEREIVDVLDALVRHAGEAMGEAGGDLTILTLDTPERVVIEVTDTGPVNDHAGSRGMWLPGVPGRPGAQPSGGAADIDARGGRISFLAHPGRGATFRVEMPRPPRGPS